MYYKLLTWCKTDSISYAAKIVTLITRFCINNTNNIGWIFWIPSDSWFPCKSAWVMTYFLINYWKGTEIERMMKLTLNHWLSKTHAVNLILLDNGKHHCRRRNMNCFFYILDKVENVAYSLNYSCSLFMLKNILIL